VLRRLARLLSNIGLGIGTVFFGLVLLANIAFAVALVWLALHSDLWVWRAAAIVVVVWAAGIGVAFVRTMFRGY
jgi:hypothetical protein